MRKVIIIIAIGLGLSACEKDCTSKCGLIVSDGIDTNPPCYWVRIENDCSGNVKKFCLTEGNWMNAHPGEDYCITNGTTW